MSPTALPFSVCAEDEKKLGCIRVVVSSVSDSTGSIHVTWELGGKTNGQAPFSKLNDQKPVLTGPPGHCDACSSVRPSVPQLWSSALAGFYHHLVNLLQCSCQPQTN